MSKKDKPLTYKQKASISFVEQAEPAFIREMKKKLGYKEAPKLEDKFQDDDEGEPEVAIGAAEAELLGHRAEEQPQIVVLNPETDLSIEDVRKSLDQKDKEAGEQLIAEGKIVFRKPVKRTAEDESSEASSSKSKRKEPVEEKKPNSRLLSFGEDEEDE